MKSQGEMIVKQGIFMSRPSRNKFQLWIIFAFKKKIAMKQMFLPIHFINCERRMIQITLPIQRVQFSIKLLLNISFPSLLTSSGCCNNMIEKK